MVASTMHNPHYLPERGDVVDINFNPQEGFEIRKRRPALVLSAKVFNLSQSVAIVCPITSRERRSGFQVRIPDSLAVTGFISVDQFTTLDWQQRRANYRCELSQETVATVSEIVVEEIIWTAEHYPSYIPVRGAVVNIARLEHPQALVLSHSGFNYWHRVSAICPIVTPDSGIRLSNFAVEIPPGEDVQGIILSDQVKCCDWWAREAEHVCYLPDKTVDEVSAIIEAIVWGD